MPAQKIDKVGTKFSCLNVHMTVLILTELKGLIYNTFFKYLKWRTTQQKLGPVAV